MTAVAKREASPPAQVDNSTALISIIERAAADPNVNVDKLERLVKMAQDAKAQAAKVAFMSALADMQTELPVIEKRGQIKIGTGKPQGYALWEDINDAIKPVLHKHGFALSFRCGQTENKIAVTGVLSHREGHSEETTMHLPIDTSGSKNAVQAVGSSTSYGKRYTAAALLNLTSRGEDDDGGVAGNGSPISEDQLEKLVTLADEVGADKIKFCKYLKIEALADLPASKFKDAMAALEAKRGAKK